MSDTKKTKPGPEPERLVIEGDPGEALDRLLGKERRPVPRDWTLVSDQLPPTDVVVEVEDERGRIHRLRPGREYVFEFPEEGDEERTVRAVRWRLASGD